ncbi:MAG: hypothetical protein DSY38_00855 [Fusobacteria bacterium]|nr:MAG: hypothetical protein DSY38_00855 [Fusobacteriota bacterium]
MKKLKKYSDFTKREKENIDYNREHISNKEVLFLIMNLYKRIIPLLFMFLAGIMMFAALFYFFY